MSDRSARRFLPPVFVASSGEGLRIGASDLEVGILLRDLDLMTLIGVTETGSEGIAVDLDSVDGLNADDAGARFVIGRLGVRVIVTRRPALAALVADAGQVGLVHVLAFDSTGLTRALESHLARDGVGTVISPGPVLSHLTPDYLERLPRPIVAYGLIDTAERARQLLTIADSVVVGPDCARALAEGVRDLR
ncbi:MAG: glycerol-3-phosphate responsive antiterminator [Candidatus Limnocylindrales bacterium]